MEIAKLRVSGVRCTPVSVGKIPAGIVGATVSIEYTDPLWDGLTKTVVFRGVCTKDILNAGTVVTVPPEVVASAGKPLHVGVYGVNADGKLIIPTLWADLGRVCSATDPSGDTSADPSLPIWAQLQAMIGDLNELDTKAKENLVAAVNEVLESAGTGGGGGSAADVRMDVADGYIRYSTDGGNTWTNLIALSELVGEQGPQGERGPRGIQGEAGPQGPQGEKGDTGPQGPKGDTGAQGPKGDTGAQGPKGDKGDTGATGATGPKGDIGEQGPQGEKGDTGPAGKDGSDAAVTADNIKAALGYTPADSETVSKLNSELTNLGISTLPDYYTDYLAGKIEAVKGLLDEAGADSTAFIFFSDTHKKQPYAPMIAKTVADKVGINHVIFGGDFCGYSLADEATTLNQMDLSVERYKPILDEMLIVKGNHDGAYGAAEAYHTAKAKAFSRLWRFNRADGYGEDGTYCYVDDFHEKTRYILIDTFDFPEGEAQECVIRQSQYDWLKDALNVNDGWSVAAFCHVPPVPAYADIWEQYTTLRDFLGAYKNKTAYSHSWEGVHGDASGGYTNLFSTSGEGYSANTDFSGASTGRTLSNYIEFDAVDNATVHFKGATPYKYKVRYYTDQNKNETAWTAAIYCTNAPTPIAVSDYDSDVKVMTVNGGGGSYGITAIQLEFRETIPDNMIITVNQDIVEADGTAAWDALNISADFMGYKGDFIGLFAGHIHNDYLYDRANYGGIDVMTICCDANLLDSRSYNDAETYPEYGGRASGTVYEQCLDVVVVNRAAKTVKTVRIGAGDQNSNYGSPAAADGYNRSFTY